MRYGISATLSAGPKAPARLVNKRVPNVQLGRELRPRFFGQFGGRALRDIIDPLGRTYVPNPYDIPQWRFRVLKFCAEFILTMIHCREITYHTESKSRGMLDSREDMYKLAKLMRDIRNNVSWSDQAGRVEGSAKWDPSIKLLKVSRVRRLGERVDAAKLLGTSRDATAEEFMKEKGRLLKRGCRLVAVVTAKQLGGDDYDKVLTQWTLAFDVTSGARAEILMNELAGNGHYDVELYNLPGGLCEASEMIAREQTPQFIRTPPR